MAEENPKSLSARGAFAIGLVLGAGLLLIYTVLETSKLKADINKLNQELALTNKRVLQARSDLIEMLKQKGELPGVKAPAPAPDK